MRRKNFCLHLLSVLMLTSCGGETITINSLLDEMIDREAITYLPVYTLRQASSYDRATTGARDSTWFANWDRSMFVREEQQPDSISEYVMMDEKGPGAIVRFWMTFTGPDCGQGVLKIYLDGSETPAIEGKALDIVSGGKLVGAPLSTSVSEKTAYEMRGHNLYFPIPYANSCKVTYKTKNIRTPGAKTADEESVYYNINFRTYPVGTHVETFTSEQLKASEAKIIEVNNKLAANDRGLTSLELSRYHLPKIIPAGGHETLRIESDETAIREIVLKLPDNCLETVMRQLVVQMAFDDEETVWTPIGDFFGTGYKLCEVNNWYTSVSKTGEMKAYWVMPFKKNCVITLRNLSDIDIELPEAYVETAPYEWTDRSLHFGSSWHQLTNLATGMFKNNEGGGGAFDVNLVELTGQGVYVGDAVTLFNTVYAWWGEGDEKIFVDGEDFPSHIGTGTEDYYGYAWCRPEVFIDHPFISQPSGDGSFEPGYTVNLRYRSLDGIPFKKSIKVDLEMWHWTKANINFAPTTFWYLRPGGTCNSEPDIEGAKAPLVFKRTDLIPNQVKDNLIEGEALDLVSCQGGNYRFVDSYRYGWSDDMEMIWSDAVPGNSIDLQFVYPEAQSRDVKITFTGNEGAGSYAISLNGKPLGEVNMCRIGEKVFSTSFSRVALKEGDNVLSLKCLKLGRESKPSTIGIDKIEF